MTRERLEQGLLRPLLPSQRGSPNQTNASPQEGTRPGYPGITQDAATGATFVRLRLVGSLVACTGDLLVTSVTGRVGVASTPVVAVILDLRGATVIDDEGCLALVELRGDLRPPQIQLRLAVSAAIWRRLHRTGVLAELGSTTVHPSVRVGVLAAYELLPGPGVVNGALREVLAAPAEPIPLEPAREP